MSIRPWVIVEPPDSRGLRRVSIGGEIAGGAWSLRDLRKILGRHGYPEEIDMEDRASVCWRGGDSSMWPDRAWRRRTTIVLMMAGLLASMVLNACVIGWPDALRALTFAQRITGVLFVLSGVVLGAASLAVLDYWGGREFKFSGAVVLLGVLIALATDSLLIFMWLEEREYTPYLLAFIPLWCWSVWALCLLVQNESWREVPKPKQFAAGVISTALLTGVSLAYSTMYQPVSAPLHLRLEVELGKPREDRNDSFIQIPMKLYMKNTGAIPVYIVNDGYAVIGRSFDYSTDGGMVDGNMTDDPMVKEWVSSVNASGNVVDAERHVSPREDAAISSGHFYGPSKTLSPGEEYVREKIVQLPESADYDSIEAELSVAYMRKDRGKIDLSEFAQPRHSWDKEEGQYYCPKSELGCTPEIIYRGGVRHSSSIINVTRKPRFVTAYWLPKMPPEFNISSFSYKEFKYASSGERKELEREREREFERYGASTANANSVISFAELMASFD
ncbi:hypothetical protein ACWD25_40700 [Streptomyces sp. NPDC002920]